MAESGSSSTIESKNDNGVVCKCRRSAKIVRAWTDENRRRRFYGCQGCKVMNGYESCNFFRWFDVEKPHGWQYLALLEARDLIRAQKVEIGNLKNKVRALAREAGSMVEKVI
ncbi:unnamed protein product [Arabis nemorensis]|uniref:GRF-type domain-containing protein n=1 Tax=Arabis nemorensis TaxID=586526 RepID=A0A565CD71_9BRAS|nr:unnamed protein product [Arabis nemorensis]